MSGEDLRETLARVLELPPEAQAEEGRPFVADFLRALERGEARAAEPDGAGGWKVNAWVKQGILLAFRVGQVVNMPAAGPLCFSDKDTLPPQSLDGPSRQLRIVPGGTAVRAGAHLGRNVTIMPPAYVNVGAHVGDGTMIDSHALVGSCAQVGRRVHVSAAAQVGGVLEPVGARPVIVEDDVLLGGGCGVYEGVLIRRRAVLGAGVVVTGSSRVVDLVRGEVYRREGEVPLAIPEGAVVVPGVRPASGEHARREGIGLVVPVIVKYRDEKTDAATALEEALR